jgi:glycogen operon protein
VLSGLKLVAEPWFGSNRPQVLGRFPPLWSQWNGDFHWAMRDFWKSTGNLGDMVDGLSGSPDLFDAADGERPTGSVNYAASHDGLTVRDTVSYTDEGQHAWNCRGPGQAEDDPEVGSLRARMQRNLLATAILAQGVPMVLYGDECGRTQGGNANAYDVDDPTTWMPWGSDQDADLLTFTRAVLRLRADHPVFRRPRFFQTGSGGIDCFRPDGRPAGNEDLRASGPVALTVHLDGSLRLGTDPSGRPVRDDASFLLLLNARWDPTHFTVPDLPGQGAWEVVLATESATGSAADLDMDMDQTVVRPARSLMVLGRLT